MNPNLPQINVEFLRQTRNDFVQEVISTTNENDAINQIGENALYTQMTSGILNSLQLTNEETEIVRNIIEVHYDQQTPQIATRDFLLLSTYLPIHIVPITPYLEYIPDNIIVNILENILAPVAAFDTQEDMNHKANLLNISHRYIAQRIELDPHSEATGRCADLILKAIDINPCLNSSGDTLESLTQDRANIFKYILNKLQIPNTHEPTGKNESIGVFNSHVGNGDSTLYAIQILEDCKEKGIPTVFICDSGAAIPVQKQAESLATQVLPLAKGIREAIKQIQELDLHTLIFTDPLYDSKHPTFLLATQKLAKIQVALQNTIVTTGFDTIHHLLIDEVFSKDLNEQFTESLKTVHNLSKSLIKDIDTDKDIPTPTRKDINSDESTIIYVSAAPIHTITPQVRETWISILKERDNSKLLLLPYQEENYTEEENRLFSYYFEIEATNQGVDNKNILILSDPILTTQTLDSYLSLGDIYLDTFPNNSLYAVSRASKLYLPIITLQGNTFREKTTSNIHCDENQAWPPSQNIEEYKFKATEAMKTNECSASKEEKQTSVVETILNIA